MTDEIREARLRPEAADRYPGLPSDRWLPATEIGARLLMQHLNTAEPPRLGNRLLDEAHFEFRGGTTRGPATTFRTRHGERAAPPERH